MLKIFNMLTQNNTNTVMKTYAILGKKPQAFSLNLEFATMYDRTKPSFFPALLLQEAGRGLSQDRRPKMTKGLLNIVLSSKSCVKEERRMFEVMVFPLPSNCHVLWSPAFQEVTEHLPADGKHWMESLICFACGYVFVSLIKLYTMSYIF